MESISKTKLWDRCEVFTLSQNMRLAQAQDHDKESIEEFANWILSLGDGTLPATVSGSEEEPSWIEIPRDLLIDPKDEPLKEIMFNAYLEIKTRYTDPVYLRDRCILAPRNKTADDINNYRLDTLPGQTRTYKSSDSICKSSGDVHDQDILYPVEF
ncbi:uncharacterized protein LOC141639237 [Silene latifolia]|uniref:uncharacterized protein LOC141639237 n=1 Tax=Silene latifolia TaxID=37657 RepID=UPI003D770547